MSKEYIRPLQRILTKESALRNMKNFVAAESLSAQKFIQQYHADVRGCSEQVECGETKQISAKAVYHQKSRGVSTCGQADDDDLVLANVSNLPEGRCFRYSVMRSKGSALVLPRDEDAYLAMESFALLQQCERPDLSALIGVDFCDVIALGDSIVPWRFRYLKADDIGLLKQDFIEFLMNNTAMRVVMLAFFLADNNCIDNIANIVQAYEEINYNQSMYLLQLYRLNNEGLLNRSQEQLSIFWM